MTIIIGGRESILRQIPQETRKKFPRLSAPLSASEVTSMLEQSINILNDENMKDSHLLFCDVIRLCLALQLSVSEGKFGSSAVTPIKHVS